MEKRDEVRVAEKDDLAQAKRELLLRFIKDQESLQTSQNDFKLSNNDATFDVLDGLTVGSNEESAKEFYNKEIRNMAKNMPKNINENGSEKPKAEIIDEKRSRVRSSRTSRPKDCLRTYIWDSPKVKRNDRNVLGREEKLLAKSALELENTDLHASQERLKSRETVRRLRSAPSLSVDPSQFMRQKEINVFNGIDLKNARTLSSLSIVVPTETKMKQDASRAGSWKHSVTRTVRPLNVSSVAISSVDVEMFDKRTVSSLTTPYAMFHLPPITSETNSTPPST